MDGFGKKVWTIYITEFYLSIKKIKSCLCTKNNGSGDHHLKNHNQIHECISMFSLVWNLGSAHGDKEEIWKPSGTQGCVSGNVGEGRMWEGNRGVNIIRVWRMYVWQHCAG